MNKLFQFILLLFLLLSVEVYGGSTAVEPSIKQYYQRTDFTSTGTTVPISMSGYPNSNYSVQLVADGTVTTFDVDVETTLDCEDNSTYTPIAALTIDSAQADSINDIKSAIGYPARCVRANVQALTLGTATKMTVILMVLRDH